MRAGLAILGSTGSIGRNTLDVAARHPDRYRIVALSAHHNAEQLAGQCLASGASYTAISDPGCVTELKERLAALGCTTRVLEGREALLDLVSLAEVDTVMAAIVGAAGLRPTLRATEMGKRILLANKESMVIAGRLLTSAQAASGADIIPVDSEHNALFQALPDGFAAGLDAVGVRQLILTASGGPFLNTPGEALAGITPEQACDHPNWKMGRKISVDSATLMNKGLEVIEARWLFNARSDQIRVVIHPQSIVHSMVAYRDGSVLAQMGRPDMRTPIAHALAWPERIDAGVEDLDLTRAGQLEFHSPDLDRFPCLGLAFEALEAPGGAAVILNAANEVAVQAFLDLEIPFMHIPQVIADTLERLASDEPDSLEEVMDIDTEARSLAREAIARQEAAHV